MRQTILLVTKPHKLKNLGNLLGNAARHTSDGLMTLTVAARAKSADGTVLQLEFTVSDTGEGISEQEQERIFRPFERADSQAQDGGKGAGLGLAIVEKSVLRMGGTFALVNNSAGGLMALMKFRQVTPT